MCRLFLKTTNTIIFNPTKYSFGLRLQPFPKRQILLLDSSKLKEFAYDNIEFDKYGKKLPERVENTVGKG